MIPSPRANPSRTSLVAFAMLLAPLLYVLSYAPVVRVCFDSHAIPPYELYAPIDWLTENTPLREPLFCWAEICGVRRVFEMRSAIKNRITPGSMELIIVRELAPHP